MVKRMNQPTEEHFQDWLAANPTLPGIGDLFFLRRSAPFEAQEDMLFLASDGHLVIVEVKNERSTRELVGQALEYAARLDGASINDLCERYEIDAASLETFRSRFGLDPRLGTGRHIVFVAPEFDVTCHVTVPYLRRLLANSGILLHLIAARDYGDSYRVVCAKEPILASRLAAGAAGASLHGTLYVVLKGGAQPVLWRVGAIDGTRCRPIPALKKLVRIVDKPLFEQDATSFGVSLKESGTAWTKTEAPEETGIVIGTVGDTCYLLRFSDGKFIKFQRKAMSLLVSEWSRGARPASDWADQIRGLTAHAPDSASA